MPSNVKGRSPGGNECRRQSEGKYDPKIIGAEVTHDTFQKLLQALGETRHNLDSIQIETKNGLITTVFNLKIMHPIIIDFNWQHFAQAEGLLFT